MMVIDSFFTSTMLRFLVWCTVACTLGMAVDRSKFRTCQQTSFCRRNRGQPLTEMFRVDSVDLVLNDTHEEPAEEPEPHHQKSSVWSSLKRHLIGTDATAATTLDPYVRGPSPHVQGLLIGSLDHHLQFTLTLLKDGTLRVRVTEVYGGKTSPHSQARVTYDELVLLDSIEAIATPPSDWYEGALPGMVPRDNYKALEYADQHRVILQLDPFALYVQREGVTLVALDNLQFEVRQRKDGTTDDVVTKAEEEEADEAAAEAKEEKEIVGYWEDGLAIYADGTREEKKNPARRQLSEADEIGLWEENFGSHKDSKPYGPMSVGMEISFPQSKHLYGIPEHASSTRLKTTTGEGSHYDEPYRLYNLDVFEYELDEVMALYGHVPLIVSQSAQHGTAGVFYFNPTETFVDVQDNVSHYSTHWISESGVIDIFVMPGPDPSAVYRQYAALTGTVELPPMFSLGYHQCRWNYKDEADVYAVHGKFEELDYPYDVLWLDIEHTDGKRYFTWDENLFPNPTKMLDHLWSQGRNMVTIIDPHIKRDDQYYIHKEATAKGLYIKDSTGKKDYDGWCWPGSSSYLDFTAEKVRSWWADQFAYSAYQGSTSNLFTWNDMNEPSVFNGPEVSMQKDLRNLAGDEHREWHNLYGMLFHRATGEGQVRRNKDGDMRHFVLSRSFFAGSQKYGAIWTGDNTAEWGHFEIATPMLLSLNTAALSFVGADVGGFFGNPDAELFTRWYQAAAYQPFFRGHAHHDSKRREPWMFDEDTLHRLRRAAMERYALLPFWYTVFYEASTSGMPVMRTMWMQYPQTESLFDYDDQFMIGADLLVKPVTAPDANSVVVRFPTNHLWYNVHTLSLASSTIAPGGVGEQTVSADIDTIPVYQRGGSVIPRKLRLRRSSQAMLTDPYTLYIALDPNQVAAGKLYMDDEHSYGHTKRDEYAVASFSMAEGKISNKVSIGSGWKSFAASATATRSIERIVVLGIKQAPKSIRVQDDELEFSFDEATNVLTIRKPGLSAFEDWSLTLS